MELATMMPHGWCYQWSWLLITLNIVADFVIFSCYLGIPILLWVVRRLVPSILIGWFAIFIFSCGVGHLIDIIVVFYPYYWLQVCNKGVTAISSIATIILLNQIIRQHFRKS